MTVEQLTDWKTQIFNHQQLILTQQPPQQTTLFDLAPVHCDPDLINPFSLQVHNSQFYRGKETGDRILTALEELPLDQRWDAVFVDEAHTFAPSWFRCCVAALKSPEDGDLMIVSDGSQSLYERQKFSWKSVGIKAQGRTRKLNQNYRNTQEILSAAWNVVQSLSAQDEDIDEDDVAFPIVEPRAALRTGQRPLLHLAANRQAEVESAIAQIQQLLTKGYESKDIAIIYRYKARYEQEPFDFLTEQLEQLGMGYYWVNQDKREYSNRRPGVRIITAKSSLGLEFKAVLILWVQQFGVGNEAEGRRELYVSMTRAKEELHLFGSGNFQVLQNLKSLEGLDSTELCSAIA
ncbi:DNA helicase (plasmid) [Planktothrix rubescens NIVA-CYA 18]|nr:DNA helicase [Planktothrix rubescens NIVA-CYA 18]